MPKTIKEIAAETGYSRTTVTLVINGKADDYRISPKAKAAIESFIAEHGYRYNQAARSLKLARSHTVALIVPDIANAFFARLASALERQCRQEGFVLVTASTGEDPAVERLALENFAARGVDGVILTPCEPPRTGLGAGRKAEMPIVRIDRHFEGDEGYLVSSDHLASARVLTENVLSAGAKDIVFFSGPLSNPTTALRARGVERTALAADQSGVRVSKRPSMIDSEEGGYALIVDLLGEARELPGGLIFGSLPIFHGAMRAVRDRLGAVPESLVVGTFAYSAIIDYLPNPVFVVRQNETEIASRAFSTLAHLMRKEQPVDHTFLIATDLTVYRG